MKIKVNYEKAECYGKECILRFECKTCAVKDSCFKKSMELAFGIIGEKQS